MKSIIQKPYSGESAYLKLILRILPYACILAFFAVLSLHVNLIDRNQASDGQTIFGHFWENSLTDFTLTDLFVFICMTITWCLGLLLLALLLKKKGQLVVSKVSDSEATKRYLWFLIPCILIILCWLPYLLTWFPGGIYSDTSVVIEQIESGNWSNRHTYFYLFCWWICMALSSVLGRGVVVAAAIMTVLQVVLFTIALAFSIYWLKRHGLKTALCMIMLAFYCLFPAFPLFAISLWKDSFFSIFLLLFSLIFIDIYLAKRIRKLECIEFFVLGLLVTFSRNNGIYIVLGSVLVLALLRRKTLLNSDRYFFISMIAMIALAILIQGPIITLWGVSTPFEENLSVPLQQLAYVICADGQLNSDQSAYLNTIMPLSNWYELYRPCLVDPIKWDESFNASSIAADPTKFWITYISVGIENPVYYAKAFFLNNCGFWDPFVGTNENVACYQYTMWPTLDYPQWDIIYQVIGLSLRPLLEPQTYPSSGLFAWFMFASMAVLSSVRCRSRDGLLFTPILLLWLTLMIATPVAYSVRYFFPAIMLVPIFFSLPLILMQHNRA